MSARGVKMLCDDISSRIDYYSDEFDMTYAEVIGVLEIIKADLVAEMAEIEEADDE